MRIKRLPILASVLLLAACTGDTLSQEQQTQKAVPQAQVATDTRLVHYWATVGNGGDSTHTRATLNTDGNYVYSAADMLFVRSTGEDAGRVYGALVLNSQDAGKSSGVTFEGDLHLVGYGPNEEPSADMPLEAILVGPNDQLYTFNNVGDQIVGPITWPQDGALTATLAQAVERYSTLTAQSTYGEQSFNLSQGSCFIEFSVTLNDGTAVNTPIGAYVWTDALLTGIRSGSVTTVDDGEGHIKANFVATFPGGTELNGAVVGLGLRNAISFGGSGTTTLAANKTYHVNRTFTKKPATISFNKTSLVKSHPDQAFINPLTNTGKGDETVTYVSSNLAVATVVATGENAGRVTIVGPGTARITATVEDGANFAYSEHDAYYDLTVYDPVPLASVTNDQVGWVIGTNGTDYGNAYVTTCGGGRLCRSAGYGRCQQHRHEHRFPRIGCRS